MAKQNRRLKAKSVFNKIKAFLLGGALMVFAKSDAPETVSQNQDRAQNEIANTNSNNQTNYSAITINTMEDMYELFDMSLNIIFAELVLEEVPMTNAYDDHGRYEGTKNTIGVGSTYSPLKIEDYDNPNANWYHLSRNPVSFGTKTISYQEMLKLVIGWAKYRTKSQKPSDGTFVTHKTVLERMFDELQGAQLRPNEFAALFCAVYNNEDNIQKLCPYIKKHYGDPIACANKLMFWCNTGAANAGTRDRCEFEALIYLNANDFCAKIINLCTKPLKKTGYSCINTNDVTQKTLNIHDYITYSNNAMTKYQCVVYSGGVCTRDVCVNAGWNFLNPLPVNVVFINELQSGYNEALAVYKQGDYQTALDMFLDLEARNASGADLWNDIAITYYNLHQYDNCIKYCKKVLKSGEHGEYAKACYNAGLAYEAKGNYDRAIKNYEAALKHYEQYGVSGQAKNVDYEQIYKKAKDRATAAKQTSSTKAGKFKTGQKHAAAKLVINRAKEQLALNQRRDNNRSA